MDITNTLLVIIVRNNIHIWVVISHPIWLSLHQIPGIAVFCGCLMCWRSSNVDVKWFQWFCCYIIVCRQVHHLALIIQKNTWKILAKIINFMSFSLIFFQLYSRNLYTESGQVKRGPHWVTIKSRHGCSSLQISTIFHECQWPKKHHKVFNVTDSPWWDRQLHREIKTFLQTLLASGRFALPCSVVAQTLKGLKKWPGHNFYQHSHHWIW